MQERSRERVFIATTGRGLARAEMLSSGDYKVEHPLRDENVTCLAADPLRPGVVYAGTGGNGVFISEDRGKSWRQAGLVGRDVRAVAASPTRAGTLYAGTRPALLYMSSSSGQSWGELPAFRRIPWRWLWFSPAEKPYTAYVQAIAPSPTNPDTILVGIEAGAVVRTEDGGRTWSRHCTNALRDCHTLVFHPTDDTRSYEAGGSGGGVAISRDGGRTWRKKGKGLDRRYGWAVAVDPALPDVWYASLSPGPFKAHANGKADAFIFRSANGGPPQKLSGGLPQPINFMPYALLTDPAAPGHLYAGLSNGDIWHSTDRGDTWALLPFNLEAIHRTLIMV